MEYSNVGIVGAGNWGTTLALCLNREETKVTLFEPVKERVLALNEYRENKEFLPGYMIPEDIFITDDPEEFMDKSEFVFFVLPSHALKKILSVFEKYI